MFVTTFKIFQLLGVRPRPRPWTSLGDSHPQTLCGFAPIPILLPPPMARPRLTCCSDMLHLRRLRLVRRQLGRDRDVSAKLVSTLVLSRLGYCNAVLVGLPASTLAPLTVLHAAARLVGHTRPCNSRAPRVALVTRGAANRVQTVSIGTQSSHRSFIYHIASPICSHQ